MRILGLGSSSRNNMQLEIPLGDELFQLVLLVEGFASPASPLFVCFLPVQRRLQLQGHGQCFGPSSLSLVARLIIQKNQCRRRLLFAGPRCVMPAEAGAGGSFRKKNPIPAHSTKYRQEKWPKKCHILGYTYTYKRRPTLRGNCLLSSLDHPAIAHPPPNDNVKRSFLLSLYFDPVRSPDQLLAGLYV